MTEQLERVELIEEECVVTHGTRRIQWFVRVGDSWQRSRQLPSAQCEQLSAGPGTVWQTRIQLELPRGTGLMRKALEPAARSARDALSYLIANASSPKQRVSHGYYKVGRAGTLQANPAGENSSDR